MQHTLHRSVGRQAQILGFSSRVRAGRARAVLVRNAAVVAEKSVSGRMAELKQQKK